MTSDPPAGPLPRVAASEAGFDAGRLAEAVAFAESAESPWPRSMVLEDGRYIGTADLGEVPPDDAVLGEVFPRGGAAGLVLRGGRVAAEWGDPLKPDMTFSIAKSYLALLAGVALGQGLIGGLDEPVAKTALDDGFASAQNRAITWRHLLQQTSEWEGTLFDKADRIDRNRVVGGGGRLPKGTHRDLSAPGTYWEYNDVRVNRLALALLHVFRRPLPEVLRETIMAPVGASESWAWRGYRNSTVEIDGRLMESVSGGAHWGGGMVISSEDHARVGHLVLRQGRWNGAAVLPEGWVRTMAEPCPLNPGYGLLWWLNPGGRLYPSAPATSLFAIGMGTNLIWVDPDHDLVVVARWIVRERVDGLVARVLASLA